MHIFPPFLKLFIYAIYMLYFYVTVILMAIPRNVLDFLDLLKVNGKIMCHRFSIASVL